MTEPLAPMQWGSAPELVGPRHFFRVQRLAETLRAALPRGHVLDAGCGAGTLTIALARRGYRVTAVDDSAEFVEHVRTRVAQLGLSDRVEVERAACRPLPLAPASFDGVVCGEVLEHLPDDGAAVDALARGLRTGGVLALTVPAGAERYDWLDRWAGHERRYDEADLRQFLEGAGLTVDLLVRWGFPFMSIYEQRVQRPGFARVGAPRDGTSVVARLARSSVVTHGLGALFGVDRLFDGSPHGTGFIARARKP